MKGRSHRLPSTEPPDDWGDGSWTVNCVCGVTFDDGEEMVNCDECGVWVHTRCSRFVKGQTSFACDKCKSKKLRGGGGGNENNEETEVAQLLVELPTKTVRMEPPPPVYPPARRAALRLWTEMPVEERVHVQGIPGGDPALVQGLSSVFTSELWKCAGYVPKKFNFQYREFPCWVESENPVDKGAGVLFSLSKERIPCSPSVELDRERKVSLKGMDGWEGGKGRVVTGVFMRSCVKERNQLRQGTCHIGKRKKEDAGTFKDGSGKKKATRAENEAENKKGRTPSADSRKSELSNKELSKVLNTDFQDLKGRERRENSHFQIHAKPELRDEHYSGAETKDVVKAKLPTESSRNDNKLPSTYVKRENVSQESFVSVRQSPGADTSVLFVAKVKDEEHASDVDVSNNCNGSHKLALRDLGGDSSAAGVQSHTFKSAKRDDSNSIPDTLDVHMPNPATSLISPCSQQHNADLKSEVNVSQNRDNMECPSSSIGDEKPLIQYARTSSGNLSQYLRPDRTAGSQDHRSADLGVKSHMNAKVEVPTSKEASHVDLGSDSKTNKVDDSLKLGTTNLGLLTPYPHKLVGGASKTSRSSSTVVSNKSAVTAVAAAAGQKPSMYSVKQRLKVNVNSDCKKESVSTVDTSTDDKVKGLAISGTKAYSSPRNTSLSYFSKHGSADAQEESHCQSFKAGRAENTGPSDAREDATLSRGQGGRVMENKLASSSLPRKCEKISQSSSQLSTKVVDQSLTVPGSASPNISDEEFALLLHHQLNSSPRVSRVPRLCQASNMAQLASPSVGMPMKRLNRTTSQMASGEKRAASAVGARTARACDSCIRRRARWYCTADDAFLCQGCDTSVHSANLLASRHQRVRLKAASTSAALVEESLPAWFCRKARTPRHSAKSTKLAAEPAPALLVPDLASDDHSHEDIDDQLLCRVPIFDPYVADFCSPSSASGQEFFADDHESKPLALVDGCDASDDLPSILPDDVDLADFVADVDELFGGGLHDVTFGMEGLVEDDVEACFGKRGTRFKMEDDEAEDLAKCPLDRELNFRRDMFDINFDSGKSSTMDKEEEEKMPVGAITVAKAEKRKVLSLRLDWKAVIAAWASQGSPWTTGNRPQVNLDDLWPDIMGGCGSEVQPYGVMRSMVAMGDGGREARVSRYREKRRTRLFSKKIRYEVRKLNAEKRPRMKGRFVKRVSIAAQQGFAF